jgi:hypothetical protein
MHISYAALVIVHTACLKTKHIGQKLFDITQDVDL